MAGARRVVRGVRTQEALLLDQIARRPESTVVMFPHADALSVPQYLAQRRRRVSEGEKAERLAIVMLDGTPGQARNMERFLPAAAPRVRLDSDNVSWLNELRPQTEVDRVCTAQGEFVHTITGTV